MPTPPTQLPDSPFKRLWRGYLVARLVAAVLLALGLVATAFNSPQLLPHLAMIGIYGALAVLQLALSPQPPSKRKVYAWLPTIGLDLLLFSLLEVVKTGTYTLTPVFGLIVLIAGILGGWLVVLGTCAYVAIYMMLNALSVGSVSFDNDPMQAYFQAGLAGAAYFAVGILVRLLASRVERERILSLRSSASAHQQEQVNSLVLQNLADSVMVVNRQLQVHTANPAAMLLLQHPHLPLDLASLPAWRPVVQQVEQTFQTERHLSYDLSLLEADAAPVGLHVRSWLTHALPGLGDLGSTDNEPQCLLFIHDLREMEARLRTEKMASMGRMSAAVAHEIRNPLAAISQANALLDEDLSNPLHKRLTAMVQQNAMRLGKIAEDILDIARVQSTIQPGEGSALALDTTVQTICEEWLAQEPDLRKITIQLNAADSLVEFDNGHLQQLLGNLLDNALRYHSTALHALRVITDTNSTGATMLTVWSDGAAIEPSIQKHLFEPFFSSESRSSGLGLYICRELCTRHGAIIRYARQDVLPATGQRGNAFVVQFRHATATPSHPALLPAAMPPYPPIDA